MAWKSGYWYGSGFGGASVPFAQYTHVLYESISPNGGAGIDTSPADLSELATFVASAHGAGAKALICIGVADGSAWQGSTNSGNIAGFVSAVASFVSAYNLDGVDLDWESSIIDSQYADFIQRLRSALGSSKTISMAAYGGGTGNPKHAAVLAGPSNLDQINMMTYDMDIYESQTWFETAVLKGPDSRTSIQTAFEEFTAAGIPASKLGIGIPFYGSRYNGASGPNQSRSYGGFVAYSNINPSGAAVDSTYQGTGVGANPWITFVGSAEIADIVAYGTSVGVGGFFTFPVNWENLSNTLSGDLNTAVGGGSSPVLPTIYSFSSDTTAVASGGPVTFTFSVANATLLSINGTTVTGTSHTFNPTTATDYVLTATNTNGSVTSATIHVAIGIGAPTISSFTATPANFVIGQPVTLSWVQSLGTSAAIDNGVGSVTGLSSKVVNPGATTTYALTVTNSAGTSSLSATATLGGAPPVIDSLTATTTSSTPGASVTISFGVSGAGPGAGSITLNGVPVSGPSVVVAPLTSTKYILVVSNADGSVSRSITIDIIGPSPNNLRIWQTRDADHHGTDDYWQNSDGTGTLDHFAKYNVNGSVTDSQLTEAQLIALIAAGSGSGLPIGQIPRGAINGSNTVFQLDFSLEIPYSILMLNGRVIMPDIQHDPAGGTMACSNGQFDVTGWTLTVGSAPEDGSFFYIWYWPKDALPKIQRWELVVTTAFQDNAIGSTAAHVSQWDSTSFAFGQIPAFGWSSTSAKSTQSTDLTGGTYDGVKFDASTSASALAGYSIVAWVDNYQVDSGIVQTDADPYQDCAYLDVFDAFLRATYVDGSTAIYRPTEYTITDGEGMSGIGLRAVTNPSNAIDADAATAARVQTVPISGALWTLFGFNALHLTDWVLYSSTETGGPTLLPITSAGSGSITGGGITVNGSPTVLVNGTAVSFNDTILVNGVVL